MDSERPPVLLTVADFYYGTLAAARCLGRYGIRVACADPQPLAAARWSRHVTQRLLCPSSDDPEAFVQWLLDFGKRNEKHVLYGTSDDTAWLLARHSEELAPHYYLYQPSLEATNTVLNKRRLHEACRDVGLVVPDVWYVNSWAELDRIAHEVRFPVLIKPATQVLLRSRQKGARVSNAAELKERYRRFDSKGYSHEVLEFDQTVRWPVIQQYLEDASEAIYSLAGFVDETGDLVAMRASRKVLQRPRKMGVGLCFERATIDERLASKVVALCKRVGYFGVFEVEFIESDGQRLLIDFNPRYYNQMRFDCDRGLPLPLLAYRAALGQHEELSRLTLQAQTNSDQGPTAYTHRFNLEILLRAQRISGALTREGETRWRDWIASHEGNISDAAFDRDDLVPGALDVVRLAYHYARHPGGFVRSMALNP